MVGDGPKRFPAADAGRSAAGGGRALQRGGRRGAADRAFTTLSGGASRRLGEHGAAGRRRLGWREQRAPGGSGQGAPPPCPGCQLPKLGRVESSPSPQPVLPGECGCSLPWATSCPAAGFATCWAARLIGKPGGCLGGGRAALPQTCRRGAWWAPAAGGVREVRLEACAAGGCASFSGLSTARNCLRT